MGYVASPQTFWNLECWSISCIVPISFHHSRHLYGKILSKNICYPACPLCTKFVQCPKSHNSGETVKASNYWYIIIEKWLRAFGQETVKDYNVSPGWCVPTIIWISLDMASRNVNWDSKHQSNHTKTHLLARIFFKYCENKWVYISQFLFIQFKFDM